MAEMAEAEKEWPHSSSVMALTFLVETPCTYISASVATSVCSEPVSPELRVFAKHPEETMVSVISSAKWVGGNSPKKDVEMLELD
jgi:hypothetical protein